MKTVPFRYKDEDKMKKMRQTDCAFILKDSCYVNKIDYVSDLLNGNQSSVRFQTVSGGSAVSEAI